MSEVFYIHIQPVQAVMLDPIRKGRGDGGAPCHSLTPDFAVPMVGDKRHNFFPRPLLGLNKLPVRGFGERGVSVRVDMEIVGDDGGEIAACAVDIILINRACSAVEIGQALIGIGRAGGCNAK
jgi:hypothetical protein